jgi:hypothetical protein
MLSKTAVVRLFSAKQTAIVLLGLYLALCSLAFKSFQYIAYKDEVNFISIGERFARGDFLNGPNAYWGSLLPLLIAAVLKLGIPSITAAKIANIVNGALAFLALRALSSRFVMSEPVRLLVLLISVPILVYYAYFAINPDLLFTAILLFYFSVVFDPAYPARRGAGWICGLLGAAAYLDKGFGFPFFVIHFSLITIAHLFVNTSKARRQVLWKYATGLLIFGCIALAWGYMLNRKYHDSAVWIGISGPYNHATRGPDFYDLTASPITKSGFVQPWAGDVSIWQEPYYFLKQVKPWSPFASLRALKHQVKLTRTSTMNIVRIYGSFTALWAVIVLGSLLLIRGVPRKDSEQFSLAASLATMGLYTAFFMALHSEEHYFWPMSLLILVMGGALLDLVLRSPLTSGVFRKTVAVVAFAVSFLLHPIDQILTRANEGRGLARISERLRADGVSGRIASNFDYGSSVVVAYQIGATYYGHPKLEMTESETISELKRHRIQYYLAWSDRSPLPHSVVQRIESFEEDGRQLTLYAVRADR